jgi:uncharacterized membrane protein
MLKGKTLANEGTILQVQGFNHGNTRFFKVFECFPIPFPFQPIILPGFLANMVTCLAGVNIHIQMLLNINFISYLVYERMRTGNV